jgi:hypothetical protein
MFRHLISLAWLLAMMCLLPVPGRAQSSDPQAVALASQALNALTGGTQVNDVILQASGTFIAGSDQEMGPATLEAKGNGETRMVLNLTGGTRQEIRNGPAGAWIGPDGTPHPMALHNCWTDASWFFPLLSLAGALNDPTVAVTFLGQESADGRALFHLRFYRVVPGQSSQVTADILRLSALDIYLDASSYLPLVASFNTHPDSDASTDIPVRILFGGYRATNGIQVPFRIQKLLQGTLTLDLIVAQAATNSGLPDSEFTIPQLLAGGAP